MSRTGCNWVLIVNIESIEQLRLNQVYSDKLAHVQVAINCRYFVAQSCTREDTLADNIGALYFDDIMSLTCSQHYTIVRI